MYLKNAFKEPQLSNEEHIMLIKDYKENGNQESFEKLLKDFDGFIKGNVINFTKSFSSKIESIKEDLLQEAYLGFYIAVMKYKEGMGATLKTYAYKSEFCYIWNYLTRKQKLIRINSKARKNGQKEIEVYYLDNIAYQKDGKSVTFLEKMESETSVDDISETETMIDFEKALDFLTTLEKYIFTEWFFNNKSTITLAKEIGKSQTFVYKNLKRAKEKIASSMEIN